MRFTNELVESAVMRELGERVARQRLARNLRQTELARDAGVSRSALQRLEGGEAVSIGVLIRVLQSLGQAQNLEALLPAAEPEPIELLENRGRARQRARRTARSGRRTGPWQWGDES
jgi:transcriptional regulator with XRE-family HTH domain